MRVLWKNFSLTLYYFRIQYLRMAESCPSPNRNILNDRISSILEGAENLPSQEESTSPSPTETVCLDSICSGDIIPGTSNQLVVINENSNELLSSNVILPSSINQSDLLSTINQEDIRPEKSIFLSGLGLEECEEDNDKEEIWEDCCTESDFIEVPSGELEITEDGDVDDEEIEVNSSSEDNSEITPARNNLILTPKTSLLRLNPYSCSERHYVRYVLELIYIYLYL